METTYTRLGKKTLTFFIFEKLGIFFAITLFIIGLFVAPRFLPATYADTIASLIPYAFLGLFVFLFIGSVLGWLEYIHYSIVLTDEDLKITRGLISQEELGIPYRRVKEIKIERDVIDELVGLSTLLIVVQGDEENVSANAERVLLPLLPKMIATQIQDRMLGKAEVEEMKVEKGI